MTDKTIRKPVKNKNANHGGWVLLWLLGFFLTFAAVDAFFVYKALSTHSGVVTEDAYQKGLKYNKTLDIARAQENMNVAMDAEYIDNELRVRLDTITDAKIAVKLLRPVRGGQDFALDLSYDDRGYYSQEIELPLKGLWIAEIKAEWQDTETNQPKQYMMTERLILE